MSELRDLTLYHILIEDGLGEVYAHSPEEASEKFLREHPEEDHLVFLYGEAPKYLSLSEYRACLARLKNNHRMILLLEEAFELAAGIRTAKTTLD